MTKWLWIDASYNKNFRLEEEIASAFDLDPREVARVMCERNILGSTQIADDITLPHVELSHLRYQGIAWIKYDSSFALVLVIDKEKPSRSVVDKLGFILEEEHLKLMRQVNSQQMLEEVLKNAGR
ncbi:hypothetical protein [Weissella soli]|jgi:mannitol/fructose-specific phosphotransferase system IIA component (Ntr-type)|uniref:hypothetical protein n=1 Tax=Weissella soli TaxID=155866 RepID=UPI003C7190AB